jgi:hypothetical protein
MLKSIFSVAAILCFGLLSLAILDFTALHDIRNEYISHEILAFLGVTLSDEVPSWTANEGEWDYLTVSLILRFLAYIIIFGICTYLYRKLSKI